MDVKTEMTREIEIKLISRYGCDEVSRIMDDIEKVLINYDVSKACTAVAIYDDENTKLIKRYRACLMIDGKSDRTIRCYGDAVAKFSDVLGIPFKDVTTNHIRYYLATEKERGVSDCTLENVRSYIMAFFQWLTDDDIIPKNPAAKIKPVKFHKHEEPPFTDTEVDAMRSACESQRDRAILEMLLASGVRADELVSLDIGDIDESSRSVLVRHGKGDKERTTYISKLAKWHLDRYIASRPAVQPSDPLFLARGGIRLSTDGLRYILRGIGARSGVSGVHAHRFRHTMASNLNDRGIGLPSLQALLGHASISTTMMYVHTNDSKVSADFDRCS